MSDYAIRAELLSKQYRIGGPRQSYQTLRDSLAQAVTAPFRRLLQGKAHPVASETVWALKDVTFEIKQGEVVGIIGRNGAGKSTLLKILGRITTPTEGQVAVRGRVASLLEVGTGFHPELTGRENVFLNGAILGMTRAEVYKRFDEIVAFAGIERYLDTPVKYYSSGMYMRLAFAVAAHLETDVLLVDEVLAVGDAEFQKKCLGQMSKVASSGRTVIFVSHNMDAMRSICSNGIYLDMGKVALEASIGNCIDAYLANTHEGQSGQTIYFAREDPPRPQLVRIEILDRLGNANPQPATWDYVKFRIFYYSPHRVRAGSVVLYISNFSGVLLTLCSTAPDSAYPMSIEEGENFIDCDFPQLSLSAGSFIIGAGLAVPNMEWLDNRPHAATFQVYARDVFGSGLAPVTARYPVPIPHYWHRPGDAAMGCTGARTTAGAA